jgi:hypothetical protein
MNPIKSGYSNDLLPSSEEIRTKYHYADWIQRFHRDGFLVIPSVLTEECSVLKEDLQTQYKAKGIIGGVIKRMFEISSANLNLFWKEPIVTFAERLIGDDGSLDVVPDAKDWKSFKDGMPAAQEVHVIHNNSYSIRAGRKGLANALWHQDDTPHITSMDGQPIKNVRLNVLAVTCNYYLSDVLSIENGPTEFIPGSHLFGRHCTNERAKEYAGKTIHALGPVGSCVLINNQVWHRGCDNTSERDRPITQITYAKRLVGHKYGNFIDYQLPQHVIDGADTPRKRRLIGFLGHGAYG